MPRNLLVFATLTLYFFCSLTASAEDYRGTISVFIENKGILLNHIQVIDMYAKYGFPEECTIAKEHLNYCGKVPRKRYGKKRRNKHKSSCADAKATLKQPNCQIENLVFNDWVASERKVKLEVFTNQFGYGGVSVRALNNTESWTLTFWLNDGDTVGHQ